MNKKICFYDLDGTLWKLRNKIWLIDKEKPYKPIFEIDLMEFALINNGYYRKDNLKIDYNGKIFYISKKMFDRIQKKIKTENTERLGISFVNYTSKNEINNSELELLLDNIRQLAGDKFTDVAILTARSSKRNHSDVINKLRLKLKDLGIEITKIYFVADDFSSKSDQELAKRKSFVLLEHLVGFKISKNKFTDEKQDWYPEIEFYDDYEINIDYANNIQQFFNELMEKTDDNVHKIIMDRLDNYKLKLTNNLVTNNVVNRFKSFEIKLKKPNKYPMFVEKFNKFRYDKGI